MVVGESRAFGGNSYAVRWVNGVPALIAGFSTTATSVSADGRIVVGRAVDGGTFVWDPDNGLRSLTDILTGAGVDLTGLTIGAPGGISADGSTVVGTGRNETTRREFAWVARLTATPCAVDLTGDGLVDFSDYLEFLNLFDAQDPRVDYTGDGLVDFSDYLEFLNLYEAGC